MQMDIGRFLAKSADLREFVHRRIFWVLFIVGSLGRVHRRIFWGSLIVGSLDIRLLVGSCKL